MRIAHIVNPVAVPPESPFAFVQQVTFESMRAARDFAAPQVDVRLYAACYPEERAARPRGFAAAPDLRRSVLDIGDFQPPRKLPLLGDILQCLYQASDAEYFVYTNADIGLQPYFYRWVAAVIVRGYDAFTINRRTLPAVYASLEDLPAMYAHPGEAHRGWDCFVFRREALPRYDLGTVCLAAPPVGLALLANLTAGARRFRQFTAERLTFHLGNDRRWNAGGRAAYARHNQRETLRILRRLEASLPQGFSPGSPPARYLRWHRTPLRAWLYRRLTRLYIPARYTRRDAS